MTPKRLTSLLESFVRALDTFKAALDQHAKAIHEQQQAAERQREPEVQQIINPELRLPVAVSEYCRAQAETQPAKERRERIRTFLEIAAFLAAAILAYFTYSTLQQVKRQADAAEHSLKESGNAFRTDERAWVAFDILNLIFQKGYPLEIVTEFTNSGKTPALKVQTCQVAEIVENSRRDIDLSCPDKARSPGFTIVMPGRHLHRLSNAAGYNWKGPSPTTDGLLNDHLLHRLSHDSRVFLYGRVDYRDVFDKPHWITFCSILIILPGTVAGMPQTKNWVDCQNGNDVNTNH